MALEVGGRIFCHFPVGNTANTTEPSKPFISKPARCPAVSGIGDRKSLLTMGCNPGLIADDLDRLDSV